MFGFAPAFPETVEALVGLSSPCTAVAWSHDGEFIASGHDDGYLRLWDAASGEDLCRFTGHEDRVLSVAFSPDGATLASGSWDRSVRLWDVVSYCCLAILAHLAEGWVAYTPEGRFKLGGEIGSGFWHLVGLCRFKPGELDPYLPKPLRMADDELFVPSPPAQSAPAPNREIDDMTESKKSPRVFISHASADKSFVRKLVQDLKNRQLPVWYDEQSLGVGDSIVDRISEGLSDTDYLAIVLSKASVESRWVKAELNAALMHQLSGGGTVVLPLVIDDCEIPPLLRDRLYADFGKNYQTGLDALLGVLGHEITSAKTNTKRALKSVTDSPPDCLSRLSELRLADLRRRMAKRLSRAEVGAIWFDTFEKQMEDDMAGRELLECIVELLDRARRRQWLDRVIGSICDLRDDLGVDGK